MHERITYAPTAPRSAVLVVGCRAALLAHCRAAAGLVSVELESAEFLALANAAAELRPLAILISADLYSLDPDEFDSLARAVGARRMLVEDGEPLHLLVARLRDVVKAQQEIRAREAREPARRHDPHPAALGFPLERCGSVLAGRVRERDRSHCVTTTLEVATAPHAGAGTFASSTAPGQRLLPVLSSAANWGCRRLPCYGKVDGSPTRAGPR